MSGQPCTLNSELSGQACMSLLQCLSRNLRQKLLPVSWQWPAASLVPSGLGFAVQSCRLSVPLDNQQVKDVT